MKQPATQFINSSIFRYLFVGGTAFAAEYISFIVMYRIADLKLVLANGLSFCLGLATSFLLNRAWTFATHEYKRKAVHQFGFYVSLSVINLLATILLLSIFTNVGINPNVGKLLAMAITSSWNFLIFKRLIFVHHRVE